MRFAACLAFSVIVGLVMFMALCLSQPKPRLVGYGCEGASAPMYAMEEDELPRCERIEGT